MKPSERLSPDPVGEIEDAGGFVAGLVPNSVALRCLSVELRAPREIVVGEPARFMFRVENRFPIPLSVRLPTSKLWGWSVNGIPEADERGFEPPETPRTVAFRRQGVRLFEGTWDGQIRRAGDDGDVWRPIPGTQTLSAFLATDTDRQNLADSVEISVVSR
ncbi:hypothetical protein V5735_13795 (plasmid) [Haladaptatus sp. SPP-AMP-3]|uniref:hypothetical protein n=1 Tax=Haladaptatus sp. SPP-AMP-3 TaxID=3121295 RepID=UPI003C2E6AF9